MDRGERMARNELRIARLIEIDYEKGYGKVVFENLGMLEVMIPFCNPNLTLYPNLGDLVLVGYTFDNQAFILGHFYNDNLIPVNKEEGYRVLELGNILGESQIIYDTEENVITLCSPMETVRFDGCLSEIIEFWKENKEKIESWKESGG